jgi:hypothetical protein
MRLFFVIFIAVHGLIHLLGFVKAFKLAEVAQLAQDISKAAGAAWLLAAALFIITSILFLLQKDYWWMVILPALVISQTLIILYWGDAKFGTIANIIILVPLIISIMGALPSSFHNIYKSEVRKGLERFSEMPLVREDDLRDLPVPVQKYLRYAGVVGKPKVKNFRAVFSGQIKPRMQGSWMDFISQQYDFLDDPTRIFYIESRTYGIPFDGLHLYADTNATMQIRVASLIQVVDAKGEKMFKGETVTLFNDMCIMAPASLIDKKIQWKTIDAHTVKATFTNRGTAITVLLYFNEKGELINFMSDDRFMSEDGKIYKNYKWSTPIRNYKNVNGRNIAGYGETVWHTPEGDFTYGRFYLVEIAYNCKELK